MAIRIRCRRVYDHTHTDTHTHTPLMRSRRARQVRLTQCARTHCWTTNWHHAVVWWETGLPTRAHRAHAQRHSHSHASERADERASEPDASKSKSSSSSIYHQLCSGSTRPSSASALLAEATPVRGGRERPQSATQPPPPPWAPRPQRTPWLPNTTRSTSQAIPSCSSCFRHSRQAMRRYVALANRARSLGSLPCPERTCT